MNVSKKKRRIVIIVGSENDLPQTLSGLQYLQDHGDYVEVLAIHVASQHRHTLLVQDILINLSHNMDPPDAIIVAAGWANHLTGCTDAFLRFTMLNEKTVVIGVAIEDLKQKIASHVPHFEDHNLAAILSITCVPGTQVVFKNETGEMFIGGRGFYNACVFATSSELPKISLKKPPTSFRMSLSEAIELATKKQKE